MKIDRDLLNDITHQPDQQHLVRMLIEIARGLGLKTVAEGVETAEIAAWLKSEKVDMMQGYYFGKPRRWSASGRRIKKAKPVPPLFAMEGHMPAHVVPDVKAPTIIRVASSQH